jgi:DNA-3-methyladenine glycosylase II
MIALTIESLYTAADLLAQRDPALARVVKQYGYPPLWERAPSFGSLVHIILEQQVSLASAQAAFTKLSHLLDGSVLPSSFLTLDDQTLRDAGFSRQKTLYTRGLAEAVLDGSLPLDQLSEMDDEAVKTTLKQLKGIGDWTADVFLTACLLRPDILPKGDIALYEAYKVLYELEKRPHHDDFVAGTVHWSPWRSVGIRLLWHFYLSERGR